MKRLLIILILFCIVFRSSEVVKAEAKSSNITITTKKATEELTNKKLKIRVSVKSSEKIVKVKWAYGKQKKEYFTKQGKGIRITKNAGVFYATKNGTYTIYAQDSLGNETIKSIHINTIDMGKPTISYTLNTNLHYKRIIDVKAFDSKGIDCIYYVKGNVVNPSDRAWNTASVVENNTFTVYENAVYSVKARDMAGNEIIKQIVIDDIKGTNLDKNYSINQWIPIETAYGNYKLKVDSIVKKTIDQKSACLITYTYQNESYQFGTTMLYIGENRFKCYDRKGNLFVNKGFAFDGNFFEITKLPAYCSFDNSVTASFITYSNSIDTIEYSFMNEDKEYVSVKIKLS